MITAEKDKELAKMIEAFSAQMKGRNQEVETVITNQKKAVDEISAIKPDQDALDRIRRSAQSVRMIVADTEARLQKYQAKA